MNEHDFAIFISEKAREFGFGGRSTRNILIKSLTALCFAARMEPGLFRQLLDVVGDGYEEMCENQGLLKAREDAYSEDSDTH